MSLTEAKAQVEEAIDALQAAGELPDGFGEKKGCGSALLLVGLAPLLAVMLLVFFIMSSVLNPIVGC